MHRISITFSTVDNKIIVEFRKPVGNEVVEGNVVNTYGDVEHKEYNDRDTYIVDWPDRAADCDVMGWE